MLLSVCLSPEDLGSALQREPNPLGSGARVPGRAARWASGAPRCERVAPMLRNWGLAACWLPGRACGVGFDGWV